MRFAMLFGPTLVSILVTQAALDNIELVEPAVGGHLACFNKHRAALEQIASAKHQQGQFAEGGAVVLELGDVKTIPSS